MTDMKKDIKEGKQNTQDSYTKIQQINEMPYIVQYANMIIKITYFLFQRKVLNYIQNIKYEQYFTFIRPYKFRIKFNRLYLLLHLYV